MQEMQETWVRSLGQEDSLEKEMATCSNILANSGKFHLQRSLAGYIVHGLWSWLQLSERTHMHIGNVPQDSTRM